MKKLNILLLLLAIFVALTVLVSCGGDGSQTTDDSSTENNEVDNEEASDESCFKFYPLDDGTFGVSCDPVAVKFLTKLVIPSTHNGKKVSAIVEKGFRDCNSLISIKIPNSVTSIGSEAFKDCSSLESITLPFVGNGSDKTHFGYIFGAPSYSDNNKYGYVPESLKSVTITGGTRIDSAAFNGCSALTSIVIPNSVTSIGNSAFKDCSALTSIVIPNSVTSIEAYAFAGCTCLTNIVIPNSVTSIGVSSFRDCNHLTIYCEAESKPDGWNSYWNFSVRHVVWGHKK